MQNGEIPETKATTALADRFERILFDSADPLKELGLRRGRGEKIRKSADERWKLDARYVNFIIEKLKTTSNQRGALTRAIDEAAEHFNKSRRQIETIWGRHAATHRMLKDAKESSDLWEKYLTKDELEAMKDRPATEADSLALQRQRANLPKSK